MASDNAAAVNLQTGVHLQYIRERGYVVLENVLSADEVAGSAVIFDHRLWHTPGLNTSATDRLAIFVAYGYRWIRRRDEIPVFSYQVSDLGSTLRVLLDELPPETT